MGRKEEIQNMRREKSGQRRDVSKDPKGINKEKNQQLNKSPRSVALLIRQDVLTLRLKTQEGMKDGLNAYVNMCPAGTFVDFEAAERHVLSKKDANGKPIFTRHEEDGNVYFTRDTRVETDKKFFRLSPGVSATEIWRIEVVVVRS